ncbi:hypothetical protein SRHO_G00033180 [Serrasalmus rhombeus]
MLVLTAGGSTAVKPRAAKRSSLSDLARSLTASPHDPRLTAGLFYYCYNIILRAGYLALFGNETAKTSGNLEKAKETDRNHSDELFTEFRKYDQLFPKLAYGVLGPLEKMEAERLKRLFWNMLSVQKINSKENISGWVMESQQVRAEQGMDEIMLNRYMFLLLWVSQGNTGPASFWLLLFLMKHPDAMKAMRGEVEEVLREMGQEMKHIGPLINLTRDMLLKTPILDTGGEPSHDGCPRPHQGRPAGHHSKNGQWAAVQHPQG